MATNWILQIAGAQMPASCRSRYVNIRVLEVAAGVEHVSSVRSKEVRRVIYESGPHPADGRTERSGRVQAMAIAQSMIARRAEIEARDHATKIKQREGLQSAISAKLERGLPLTNAEYALLG
jgi:hypothetical protein